MDRKKALIIYLIGSLGQIFSVCIMVWLLRGIKVEMGYSSVAGFVAIAIGGLSSAIWGTVISNKYRNKSIKNILYDFFNINQSIKEYLLLLTFITLDFMYIVLGGELNISNWYIPVVLFVKAIIFGGIEEIGWRYTFQPILEEKLNNILATLVTFICWGIWHLAFFYIDGTLAVLSSTEMIHFFIGLLINCFILSAIMRRTNSLWLCVMGHSLINVLSQLAVGGNQIVAYVCQVMIVIVAIVISMGASKNILKGAGKPN